MANVRFRRGSPRGQRPRGQRPDTWPDYGRSRDSGRALSASASVAAPTRLRRREPRAWLRRLDTCVSLLTREVFNGSASSILKTRP